MNSQYANTTTNMASPTTSTAESESSDMAIKLSSTQQISNWYLESAAIDCEMKNLEAAWKRKKEEERQLINEIDIISKSIQPAKKQLEAVRERESSILKNINRFRESETLLDGYELILSQNLKSIQLETDDNRFKYDGLCTSFGKTIALQEEIYLSLPWAIEKKEAEMELEHNRICLSRLKLEHEEMTFKESLVNRINKDRLQVEIIQLAKHMVRWKDLLKEGAVKKTQIINLQEKIESLENKKKYLEECQAKKTEEIMQKIVLRSRSSLESAPKYRNNGNEMVEVSSIVDRIGINKQEFVKTDFILPSSTTELCSTSRFLQNISNKAAEIMTSVSKTVEHTVKSNQEGLHRSNSESVQAHISYENSSQRNGLPFAPKRRPSNTNINSEPHPSQPLPNMKPQKLDIPLQKNLIKSALKSMTPSESKCVLLEHSGNDEQSPRSSSSDGETDNNSQLNISPSDPSTSLHLTPSADSHVEIPIANSVTIVENIGESVISPPENEIAPFPSMPPPKTRPPKRKANGDVPQQQVSKTPKRVSFVSDNLGEKNDAAITIAQTEKQNDSHPKPQVLEVPDYSIEPSKHQPILNKPTLEEATNNPKWDTTVPSSTPPTSDLPRSDVPQPTDKFEHLFPPSPQLFSALQQGEVISGNFDSIFGAIFDNPGTSDGRGFPFTLQGAQDNKISSNEQDPSKSTDESGQNFFSFFGASNTDENKTSYTDNFFKLF